MDSASSGGAINSVVQYRFYMARVGTNNVDLVVDGSKNVIHFSHCMHYIITLSIDKCNLPVGKPKIEQGEKKFLGGDSNE